MIQFSPVSYHFIPRKPVLKHPSICLLLLISIQLYVKPDVKENTCFADNCICSWPKYCSRKQKVVPFCYISRVCDSGRLTIELKNAWQQYSNHCRLLLHGIASSVHFVFIRFEVSVSGECVVEDLNNLPDVCASVTSEINEVCN